MPFRLSHIYFIQQVATVFMAMLVKGLSLLYVCVFGVGVGGGDVRIPCLNTAE